MVLTSYNAPEGSISFPEKKSIKSLFKIEGERGGGGAFSYLPKLLYDTPWPFILSLVQCP